MIRNFILIGLGGALGSMLRYTTDLLIGPKMFLHATFLINIVGSFMIGMVIAYSLKNELFAANWKLFLATGICGGFTTFSAFSFENLQLIQNGKFGMFAIYVAGSLSLGIVAVWSGFRLVNFITQ